MMSKQDYSNGQREQSQNDKWWEMVNQEQKGLKESGMLYYLWIKITKTFPGHRSLRNQKEM